MLPANASAYEYGYYAQNHPWQYYDDDVVAGNIWSVEEPELSRLDGDTVASTASSMTSLYVFAGYQAFQRNTAWWKFDRYSILGAGQPARSEQLGRCLTRN